ncbi:hypothetical protein Tco_0724585 [Tanacetum coccineum]
MVLLLHDRHCEYHNGLTSFLDLYGYIKNHKKTVKTSKHGHEERKSTKEAKDSEAKPRKVNSHKGATLDEENTLERWEFTLGKLTEVNKVSHQDCHTFNPCEIESHPTAQDDSQMIDEMIGQDSKERVQQGTA